ncbi:MAG: hypothetical protein ACR2MM_02790 [Flavobacteriaceae bacterium]
MKMYSSYYHKFMMLILLVSVTSIGQAQLNPGVYLASAMDGNQLTKYQLTVSDNYIIHTTYKEDPPEFVNTWGGFYSLANDVMKVKLEFNSNYESDQITQKEFPWNESKSQIVFGDSNLKYARSQEIGQDLDGFWLFATRGPDTGQERRGDDRARKTLKVLFDGKFQWIAYHIETYKFSGTGGGSYSAVNGIYTENIEFFSRDNSRVGAQLQFNYQVDGNDWHHKGNNSRGEPMYEIWSKR